MKDTGPLVASRTLGAGLFPLLLASFTLEVSPVVVVAASCE